MVATVRPHVVRVHCGIDVGTQGVRAVLVTDEGVEVGGGRAAIAHDHRDGPQHEQSPEDWWMALVGAVREALAVAGPNVEVAGVALDATSGTVLVQRSDGEAVGPALMYDDARAADQISRVRHVGAPLWRALGYRVGVAWALPKVLWLLENDAVPAGCQVVHQSDHLVGKLIGASVPTDTSNALKSGVDTRAIEWPWPVFGELGIRRGLLPEVVLPGTVIGTVGTDGARATGLPEGVPVHAGMTDGCAAQIAAGALDPGSWSSALGTTLVVKGATVDPLLDPSGAVYCHRNPDGGWLPGGASSCGAGAIASAFPDADANALASLTRQAAALVPIPGATYPLVGVGERFPFSAPQARGFLTEGATTPAARFAALCQAIAYVERLAYDVLADLGADVTGPVSLSGGATANDWWNQLRTDVLGRPTLVPASAQAATGMAVLAAAPLGGLAETAHRMVRITKSYQPSPERGAGLRVGYESLLDALVDRGWLAPGLVERVLSAAEVLR